MNEKQTLNDMPKKKKRKSSAGYIVAIVMLSLITLSSLFIAYTCIKLYKDSLEVPEEEPVVTYTESEVEEIVALNREDAAEQAIAGYRAELKETAENSNGIVSMLRKMYPEYFVYYDSNHYEFAEINKDIPQANFQNENIIANEGFLEYSRGAGNELIKQIYL